MDNEIKIADFVSVLRKRIWIILCLTLLITAGAGMYTKITWTPIYQTSTKILIPGDITNPELINTMGVIVKDSVVLDNVIKTLELDRSSSDLNKQITFSSENQSRVVKITVMDTNPELAINIANVTANVFVKEIGNILRIYEARVLSEARVDKDSPPINIKPRYNMDIGFAVGLVVSIGLALFLDTLNTKIDSEREAEKLLQLPVLGSVSKMNKKNTAEKGKKQQQINLETKGVIIGAFKRNGSL